MKTKTAITQIGAILPGERYIQFVGATAKELERAGRNLGVFTNRAGEPNALLVLFAANGVRAVPTIVD